MYFKRIFKMYQEMVQDLKISLIRSVVTFIAQPKPIANYTRSNRYELGCEDQVPCDYLKSKSLIMKLNKEPMNEKTVNGNIENYKTVDSNIENDKTVNDKNINSKTLNYKTINDNIENEKCKVEKVIEELKFNNFNENEKNTVIENNSIKNNVNDNVLNENVLNENVLNVNVLNENVLNENLIIKNLVMETENHDPENQLSNHENQLSNHENNEPDNENNVLDNENNVPENENQLPENENNVTDHENQLSNHENQLSNHENELSNHENELPDNVNKEYNLGNKIDENVVQEVNENHIFKIDQNHFFKIDQNEIDQNVDPQKKGIENFLREICCNEEKVENKVNDDNTFDKDLQNDEKVNENSENNDLKIENNDLNIEKHNTASINSINHVINLERRIEKFKSGIEFINRAENCNPEKNKSIKKEYLGMNKYTYFKNYLNTRDIRFNIKNDLIVPSKYFLLNNDEPENNDLISKSVTSIIEDDTFTSGNGLSMTVNDEELTKDVLLKNILGETIDQFMKNEDLKIDELEKTNEFQDYKFQDDIQDEFKNDIENCKILIFQKIFRSKSINKKNCTMMN
ncbi:hypothetical protein DMUE_4570 [Dictyocoela muelleri]|nr:hypothetical protein DMUE_4570 [Dictyocoela muelleri]